MPDFKKMAEMFNAYWRTGTMTMLIVCLRNSSNAPKNRTLHTNISSINVQFSSSRFCSVFAWLLLQTAIAVRLVPSVAAALCWAQQHRISATGPATSQQTHDVWTHCLTCTLPYRNICPIRRGSQYCSGSCSIIRRRWTFWTANFFDV